MYVPFICEHCGRQRDRHSNVVSRARHSDFSALDGYTKAFVGCPGFEQKVDQRKLGSSESYVGLEKRLKPPPVAVQFDERKVSRSGARARTNDFTGEERRRN